MSVTERTSLLDAIGSIDGPLFLYRRVDGSWSAATGWGYWAERAGRATKVRAPTLLAAVRSLTEALTAPPSRSEDERCD